MSSRKIETMSLEIDKFAVVKLPTATHSFKEYVKNFHSGKDLHPITVIKASKLKNGINLYDLSTEEHLNSDERNDYWFVIEGAERLKALMKAYKETEDNSYLTFDAIIEDTENIPDGDVIKYMVEVNYMSSRMSSKDYVDYCYMICPSDYIFQMSHTLMNEGAPISTVSRLASGKSNCFTPKVLIEYINGNDIVVKDINFYRALELYRFFIEAGFSRDFMNKRYLIDYINNECYRSSLQEGIDKILSADDNTISFLESTQLGNDDIDVIGTMLDRDYKKYHTDSSAYTYKLDYTLDKFNQNLKDIPRLPDRTECDDLE